MVPHHCKFNSSLLSKREFNELIKTSFWTLRDVFIFCETITSHQRSEDDNLPPQLDKLQQELDEFYTERVDGALIPTRIKLGENIASTV